jgi:hypothetical protein
VARSIPVLYFGNLPGYLLSPLRVITVALNPSDEEFPNGSKTRFPGVIQDSVQTHFSALNRYFEHNPLWEWFRNFDPFLDKLGTGFRSGRSSLAVHTDLCSAVATQPTYSSLPSLQQRRLEELGLPLWAELAELLDPDVIVMSGGIPMRDRVPVFHHANWRTIVGTGRKTIWAAEVDVWGKRTSYTEEVSYIVIQPPFALNLREMPKGELERYFQWFMAILPERVSTLTKAVQGTLGFENWHPDRTPASLDVLGTWFAGQVEMRPRTQEELQAIQALQAFPVDIPREQLTNRTFSLAMDVGMYLSQVFLKNYPSLSWEQRTENKRFADYGQPLISGFGLVSLNPVAVVVTLAYAIASKKKDYKRLREIYDYWAQRASEMTP